MIFTFMTTFPATTKEPISTTPEVEVTKTTQNIETSPAVEPTTKYVPISFNNLL